MIVWHVAFHPKEKQHWWARRFGHVSLAGFTNETWLLIDLDRSGVHIRSVFAHDEVADALTYLLAYSTILKMPPVDSAIPYFGRPMTCVSFVKHVLGVRSRALSPDGLFRTLVTEYGAEIVNESQQAEGDRGAEAGSAEGGSG